ncbi:hypothetical protein BXZ70DRAFT_1012396 [Cristinia sonorae]|uniref:Uncharacterized protein n=1 Tax=Cristinia sonorae TaxID=1940300 RepID=A0A8K0UEF8_9AGAR|nr:hypothetical protein BXZ70DRAFT_1012396 [Cristinia sonorae]
MPEPAQHLTSTRRHDGPHKYANLITQLQSQLQLHIARTSLLQSRLTAALDELDTAHAAHARELARERSERDRLEIKLGASARRMREVEAERDEMREVVTMLVKKVEENDQLSGWPRTSMHLLTPLEPLSLPIPASSSCPDSVSSYAAVVIASLNAQLTKERTTNARVLDYAEAEILRLQAQVARRDAELEACVVHSHDTALMDVHIPVDAGGTKVEARDDRKPAAGKTRIEASSLTREEALSVMGLVNTRNKQLETDVHRLSQRLRDAKVRHAQELPVPIAPSNAAATVPLSEQTPPASASNKINLLHDMQVQLRKFSEAIDALREERGEMQQVIDRCHDSNAVTPIPPTSNIPNTPLMLASDDPGSMPSPDLLTLDPDISSGGEQSMDLATPLQPTILLDPSTLARAATNNASSPATPFGDLQQIGPDSSADPASVPLPPSPPPVGSPDGLLGQNPSPSPPPIPVPPSGYVVDHELATESNPSPPALAERMRLLENELAQASIEIADRDVALEELRRLVADLNVELSSNPRRAATPGSHDDPETSRSTVAIQTVADVTVDTEGTLGMCHLAWIQKS